MDVFDRAQLVEAAYRDLCIRQARATASQALEKRVESGVTHCGCSALIPAMRRRAVPGVLTCIDCAREQERVSKQFMRT